MTVDAKLLPCPFCGGPAEIIEIDEGENAGGSCVCCTKCMASGNIEFGRKENFVSNWNTRTPHPAPVTAREAELEAEIERLTKARDNLSRLEQSHREQANEQFHRAEKAEAALEARDREKVREGMKWAAEIIRGCCPECLGTGVRDSGGVHPWGEPIPVPCDCTPHPAPFTARGVELEAEIERLTARAKKAEAENQRLREALKKIASTGRCEFAEVRAALAAPCR